MSVNPYESPDTASELPERKPAGFKFRLVELLVVLGVIAILVGLLLPLRRGSPEAARRSSCSNNLKHIGVALHNYHDKYQAFPPAYTVDAEGKPLHSWRTLILPYLEQQALYDKIDLSKPWDNPANKAAFDTHIPTYGCPSANSPPGHTIYCAIVGANACFQGTQSRSLADITDDRSLTLIVMEIDIPRAVHWMSPTDQTEQDVLSFGASTRLSHPGGAQAVCASGMTRFVSAKTKPENLRALISIASRDDAVAKDDD